MMRHLLLLLQATAVVASFSSGSTVVNNNNKPDWLPSFTKEELSSYLSLAKDRHAQNVRQARESYFHYTENQEETNDDLLLLRQLQFDDHAIQGHGRLPDFADELERRVFVTKSDTPLFTKQECADCIQAAETHFMETNDGAWTLLPSGQYDVAGLWIKDVPPVKQWFDHMVETRLFPLLQQQFPHFVQSKQDLCVDNAYLFKYTPETGRRTDVHTDSGCLSFTIALNGQDDYEGGGTWFEGLSVSSSQNESETTNNGGGIIDMDVGQATIRPGGVRHCGHAVTSGTRYIIGGFCMNAKKVEHVRMLLGLGSELASQQKFEQARDVLYAAIALNPHFDGPYSHLADVLETLGDTTKAQQVLEHCLEHVNPNSGEIAYSLGVIYLNQEQYDKCHACATICLQSDDCDVDAMMLCAQACAGQQHAAGEAQWLHRIVTTPGASPQVVGKAYCNLGILASQNENESVEDEINYYQKSLELLPDRFAPLYSLGCAYASQQQWGPSVDTFRQAVNAAETEEEEVSALKHLYRCTQHKLQQDPTAPSSREAMMQAFTQLMGAENFQKLAALQQQQQQAQ